MAKRDPFTTDRLFCPGPTPVPKAVHVAATETDIYHRSDEFYRVFRRCVEGLQPYFGCSEEPVIMASSGTGAMEAALVSLTAPGDEVVVVNGGKFGERWQKLAETYQCKTAVVTVAAGKKPTAEQILAAIRSQTATRAVFLQANETSTGAYYDPEALAKALRPHFGGLLVVDAISSLGAHTMRMDAWGIDCVVAGSQKGFGLPPGLAFACLSERAWNSLSKRPRFYFDLAKERKGQKPQGRSAWTPAASLVFGLDAALKLMAEAGGPDAVAAHHARMAEAARAAVKALGLELFAGTAPSNALTAITVPAGVDGQALVKHLRARFGMFFAGGQDELKGKIVRFAHLGFVSRFDLLDGLAALEFALAELGFGSVQRLGAGVTAAMQVLVNHPT